MQASKSRPFTMAAKFGINRRAAARMRIRYLETRLPPLLETWAKTGDPAGMIWICDVIDEISFLMKKSRGRKPVSKNSITEEMIMNAKDTDIREVVAFNRAKQAKAWCHEDKQPSLYYGDRTNRAICPVCNKTFNAIDVLMTRDGYSFIEAVRALN